eukprot:SAG11_NODE_447_length_9395_cov_4.121665_3_plen_325_part_00
MMRLRACSLSLNLISIAVFLFTSFTTVGYGNQPSMVATLPPCEYPGVWMVTESPFSILLPSNMRGVSWAPSLVVSESRKHQSFEPLSARCFAGNPDPRANDCWVMADDVSIFDFEQRLLYTRDSMTPPRNFSELEVELRMMEIPGRLGTYDCNMAAPAVNETQFACFSRFVAKCESQLLVWRRAEKKKNYGKIFTIFGIIIGVGILGAVAGVFGETLMSMVTDVFSDVEFLMDQAASIDQFGLMETLQDQTLGRVGLEDSGGMAKGVIVAFSGLGLVLFVGALFYAGLESMKMIDACYFTGASLRAMPPCRQPTLILSIVVRGT